MSIILTDISKRFGDHLVVNRINLEVKKGELFVLLGGSGSGKSTILRIIAGLTMPDAGRIELNGVDVTYLPPQARNIGFVFQNYSLFRHMTVAENVEFGLRIRKISEEERKQRRDELLDLVGLAGFGTRYPHQLSGGQKQRVALARALAYNPEVLLLDEPFGALDVKIRAQLRESLKEIQKELDVTTILVTHDQEEAFELADRIGVIEKGSLIEIGDPEDLYHRPKSEFVATFIGGGNVLVGRVVNGQIRLGSLDLPFPKGAPSHDEGSPVRVLFRPETVLVQPQNVRPDEGLMLLAKGQVTERIFAGSQQRLRIVIEDLQGIRPVMPTPVYGARLTQIEAIQPNLPGEAQLDPGQTVWIGLKTYHVLEPTGLKILICHDPSYEQDAALDFGCRLAESARGPTTILTVVPTNTSPDEIHNLNATIRPKHFSHLTNLSTKVRQGSVASEIISEAQEGNYEIVVLGREGKAVSLSRSNIGSIAQHILIHAALPVMLVGDSRPQIERILICTAAGEPGKVDVLFGARVARRVGAQATILHILRPGSTPSEVRRVDKHLRQAKSSLDALGVSCEYKVKENFPIVDGIVKEGEEGNYDLIIIGAPLQPHSHQFRWMDTASQVIRETSRPVIVIPMVSLFRS